MKNATGSRARGAGSSGRGRRRGRRRGQGLVQAAGWSKREGFQETPVFDGLLVRGPACNSTSTGARGTARVLPGAPVRCLPQLCASVAPATQLAGAESNCSTLLQPLSREHGRWSGQLRPHGASERPNEMKVSLFGSDRATHERTVESSGNAGRASFRVSAKDLKVRWRTLAR
jgi:hypothetical protein